MEEPRVPVSRRSFLKGTASTIAAGSVLGGFPSVRASSGSPNARLRVAVVGLSRGMAHVSTFARVPNVEVAAVCDVDGDRLAAGARATEEKTGRAPRAVADFRTLLDDPAIDVISIAMPNSWHAPATILACAAGKHVYVEKPGSYCAREGELMVEAARRHDRRVQMGNQRRSLPRFIEGIQRLREGVIGTVRASRCWYLASRTSIGKGTTTAPPARLDWALWQGPATERPYKDNLVHYNWHWHWHWGNGELGNNGVHALDISRWGLGVDCPRRVTCTGGRYHFDDDQETPDTAVASFDFEGCFASWEGSSCLPRKDESLPFVAFYGDGGTLRFDGAGYRILDTDGMEVERQDGSFDDLHHFANFADAIREGTPLNSEIGDAQKSTLLCHLGNIAYRTDSCLVVDPGTATLSASAPEAARALWAREYREGWKPSV